MIEILERLSKAPDSQIDASIAERLPGVSTAAEMKQILDECAHGALASDFAMQAMDMVWRMMLNTGNDHD